MNIFLVFKNQPTKKIFFLFWPFFICLTSFVVVLVLNNIYTEIPLAGPKWAIFLSIVGGVIILFSFEILQPIILYRFTKKYMNNRGRFFIFYFLFKGNIDYLPFQKSISGIVFDILTFLFILEYIFSCVEKSGVVFRYFFAFLAPVSDVLISLVTYNHGLIYAIFFRYSEDFYKDNLFLVSFFFMLLQLLVEFLYLDKDKKNKGISRHLKTQ